jgi:hypothetical protein
MIEPVRCSEPRCRAAPARHVEHAIDAHRIAPGLYQGSRPPGGLALARLGFSAVVLCAIEHQPDGYRFEAVDVLYAPMQDDGRPLTPEEWERARTASREVAVRLLSGKRVLVTCSAGLNRSGLVSALTLLRIAPRGFTPYDAVRRVQSRRAGALGNPYFVDAILAVDRQLR